jgi:hypothetical protein
VDLQIIWHIAIHAIKRVSNNRRGEEISSPRAVCAAVAHAVLLFSKRNFDMDPLVDPAAAAAQAVSTGVSSVHPDDQAREEK